MLPKSVFNIQMTLVETSINFHKNKHILTKFLSSHFTDEIQTANCGSQCCLGNIVLCMLGHRLRLFEHASDLYPPFFPHRNLSPLFVLRSDLS